MKVFLDMDGVIADFLNSPFLDGTRRGYGNYPEMHEAGFFESLPPIAGSLSAVRQIISMVGIENVYILSQPVKETFYSYSEKVKWVNKWFPELSGRIILTQHKELEAGIDRILIDDNNGKWRKKWEENGGTFLWFNDTLPHRQEWKTILGLLKNILEESHEAAKALMITQHNLRS